MGRKRAVAEVNEGPSAAKRFEHTMDRLLRVSKEELARREAAYQDARTKKIRKAPQAK